MNFDNDELLISRALETLESGAEGAAILDGVNKKLAARRGKLRRRTAAIAIAAAALLVTGCAAALGGLDWLGGVLGDLGFTDVMEPVEQSVSDFGIEFSLVGAQRFDDTVLAYVTVQDVDGRGRVNGNCYIKVKGSGCYTRSVDQVYFDEEGQLAAYELNLELSPEFEGDTLELALESIDYTDGYSAALGELPVIRDLPIELDPEAVASGPDVAAGGMLPVTKGREIEGMDSAMLGSVGTVGGNTAVQLLFSAHGDLNWYTIRYVYLENEEGEVVEADEESLKYSYFLDGNLQPVDLISPEVDYMYGCQQFVFELSPEELEGYTMYVRGSYNKFVAGDWNISVKLDDTAIQKSFTSDIAVGGYLIEDVKFELSPVGFRMTGRVDEPEALELLRSYRVYIVTDGHTYGVRDSSMSWETDGSFDGYYAYWRTAPPESISAIEFGRAFTIELNES